MLLDRCKAFRLRQRERAAIARNFDLKWSAYALPLFVGISQCVALIAAPALTVALMIATLLCGVLVCAYFAHLLLARLQCSLLEFLALIFVLGNAMGILLATPGVYLLGVLWVATIILFIAAWALYGAVLGLAQAKLLNASSARARLTYMVIAWFTSLSRAFLFTGLLILFSKALLDLGTKRQVLGHFASYGMPLTLLGLVGAALSLFVHLKVRRAAKKILGELKPNPAPGSALAAATKP